MSGLTYRLEDGSIRIDKFVSSTSAHPLWSQLYPKPQTAELLCPHLPRREGSLIGDKDE
ncbi:Putative LOC100161421 [Caligus rogercresseyi]|uniref:LOC100161421 n=1 Tax=Caligus rogercresseyi TaxID=217165 RepID=A0A7T8HFM0_CALRO|nr:Putative LOC100161421 [Caligus rogercresseyi]